MIKITRFDELYSGDTLGTPAMRAALLAHTASDYYRTCQELSGAARNEGPRFGVLVPALQQTIELLVKAITLKNVPDFNPRDYGHRTLEIIDAYSTAVPVFAKIAGSDASRKLLSELTTGYLMVRYGEAHVAYDGETWAAFCVMVDEMLAVTLARADEKGTTV